MKVTEVIKNTDGIMIKTDQGNYGFYGVREDIIRVVYTKKEMLRISRCSSSLWYTRVGLRRNLRRRKQRLLYIQKS